MSGFADFWGFFPLTLVPLWPFWAQSQLVPLPV